VRRIRSIAARAAARAPASSFIVELAKVRSRWSGVRMAVMLASRRMAVSLVSIGAKQADAKRQRPDG